MLIFFNRDELQSAKPELFLDLKDCRIENVVKILERIRFKSGRILLDPLPLVERSVADASDSFIIRLFK